MTDEAPAAPAAPAASNESGESRSRLTRIFNLAMLVAGGVGLAWMLKHLGWDELEDAVVSLGAWFAVVLALDLVALCCDAAALHAFMRPEARMVSYARVLAAQASGRAINVLTPTGALGEPTKLALLVEHAPRGRVLSSVVLLNLAQLYLTVIMIVLGTPIMLFLVDLPTNLRNALAIGLAVIVPAFAALAIAIGRGALATVFDTLRVSRLISRDRAARWRDKVAEIDRHIRQLQRHREHGTWKGILWVGASKIATWTATFLLLAKSGLDVSFVLAVGMLSVGVVIQWISQIVPMGLGIADGGNYALFDFLGATGAHGVVVTMLNRGRSVLVAILGLGALVALYAIDRVNLARRRRRLGALRERLKPEE